MTPSGGRCGVGLLDWSRCLVLCADDAEICVGIGAKSSSACGSMSCSMYTRRLTFANCDQGSMRGVLWGMPRPSRGKPVTGYLDESLCFPRTSLCREFWLNASWLPIRIHVRRTLSGMVKHPEYKHLGESPDVFSSLQRASWRHGTTLFTGDREAGGLCPGLCRCSSCRWLSSHIFNIGGPDTNCGSWAWGDPPIDVRGRG